MPRLPVDGKKVQELRITFGSKERQLLEGALFSYQFNKVAEPVVKGMSDVSFMIVLGTLLKIYWPDINLPTGATDMEPITDAIFQGIANAKPDPNRPTLGSDPDKNFFEELFYNLTNPNWGAGGPGVREAWGEMFGG